MSAPSFHAPRARPVLLLGLAWIALGGWLAVGFLRGETLRDDDVALPTLVFFMISAVIGSRVWLFIHDYRAAQAR